MKNLLRSLIVGCMLLGGFQLQAQDNIVKLRLGQLAVGKIELMYERVVSDNQSLVISAGFNIPRNNVPFEGVSGDTLFTSAEGSSSINGFSITPEYRFYLGQEGAPYKFYIGPYLRYRRWGYNLESNVEYMDNGIPETVGVMLDGSWSGIGGGVGIGMQWIINDVFAIDWNIIGLGLSYQRINFNGSANDPSADWTEIASELNESLGDAPLIGNNFEVAEDGAGLNGAFGFVLPSLRANISLGVAF